MSEGSIEWLPLDDAGLVVSCPECFTVHEVEGRYNYLPEEGWMGYWSWSCGFCVYEWDDRW